MTDETAAPNGPEPEPPVPGWPKESGERFDKASAQVPLLGHEPHCQCGIEQKREIQLDQEFEPNLSRSRDWLREPSFELGPAR